MYTKFKIVFGFKVDKFLVSSILNAFSVKKSYDKNQNWEVFVFETLRFERIELKVK